MRLRYILNGEFSLLTCQLGNKCGDFPICFLEFDGERIEVCANHANQLRSLVPYACALDAHWLDAKREWSAKTFGPGRRTGGVLEHIREELAEIAKDPSDLSEWADVILLALDGAWRMGFSPYQIIEGIKAKQARNEARTWPDYREFTEGDPIEHVKTGGE